MIRDDDQPLEPELREAARAYHEPPSVPRDAVWVQIQRRRAEQQRRWARPTRRVWRWAAGVAAALALGVGIGRLSVRTRGPAAGASAPTVATSPAATTPAPTGAASTKDEATAYRLATADHLAQAEAFLTLFRASVREGHEERLASATARQLLATNRLLIDSRAGTDPRLRLLLQDLELVLAQIAQLAPGRGREDLKLITDGLEQGGMMVRLRAAVPAGTEMHFRQGAL
ncbi:MAG TPA: hypothetical protein VK688_03455 [Gemmatimonadales bacterium]|jgi:hypothetical protein|nr:hypothetical protein [Gemmatimonadales bacterium]